MSAILNEHNLVNDETINNTSSTTIKLPEPKTVPKKRIKFEKKIEFDNSNLFHTNNTSSISPPPNQLTVNNVIQNNSSIRSPSSVNSMNSSSLIDSQDEDNETKLNRLKLSLDLNEWIDCNVLVKRFDLNGHYTRAVVRKFTSNQVAVALNSDSNDDLIYYDLMSIQDCISDSSPLPEQIQNDLRIAYRCPDSSALNNCSVYKTGILIAQSNENKGKYLIKPFQSTDDKLVEISRASIRLLRPPWFEELDTFDLNNQDSLNNNDNNFKLNYNNNNNNDDTQPMAISPTCATNLQHHLKNRSKQLILQHEQDQLKSALINSFVNQQQQHQQQQANQQTIAAAQRLLNQTQLKNLANQQYNNLVNNLNQSTGGTNGATSLMNLANTVTNNNTVVAAQHLNNLNNLTNLNSINSLNSLNQINQIKLNQLNTLNQLNKHSNLGLPGHSMQIHRSTTDDEYDSEEIDEDDEIIKQFSSVPSTPTTPQSTLALFIPPSNLQSAPNTPLTNYSTNAFSINNSKTTPTTSSSSFNHMLADAGSPTTLSKFKKGKLTKKF